MTTNIEGERQGIYDSFIQDPQSAKTLYRHAPLAILITDQTGRIVSLNPQTETVFGYKEGELIGQKIEVLLPEQLRTIHKQHRSSYARNPFNRPMGIGLELSGRRKNGDEFPVEIGLSAFHQNNNPYVLCFVSDISVRKQVEEQRIESETRFKTLFDANPDAVILFDRDGWIQQANETCETLFGFSDQELIKINMRTLLPGLMDSVPENDAPPGGGVEQGVAFPKPQEFQAVRKDETLLEVNVKISPLYSIEKDCLIAIVRDITERKRAERDLLLLGQIAQQMKDAVILTDNTPFSAIKYVNKAFTELYGYTEAEVLGKSSWMLFSGEEEERFLLQDERVQKLENEEEFRIRYQDRKKDGTKFWVSNTSSVVDFGQEEAIFDLGIVRDVSKEVQYEELLRRQNSFLATLHDTSLQILSNLDLSRVLESLLRRAAGLLDSEHGQIVTLNPTTDDFICQAGIGCFKSMVGAQINKEEGIFQKILQDKKALIEEGPLEMSLGMDLDCTVEVDCAMAVPLKYLDEVIGMIIIARNSNFHSEGSPRGEEMLNQIGQLASIAIQNAQLFSAVEQARQETEKQKQRMQRELEIARKVQLALLPRSYPVLEGWSFAARWKPAREVAGDYYDFITRPDGCIDLIIADVTDKGAPAALFMAHNKGMLRASLDDEETLLAGVIHANRRMVDENVGPFVTCFLARIDPANGTTTYVNAGHEYPLLYRARSAELLPLQATGLPLGIDDDVDYTQETIQIEKGDFLVLYTDGVIDAVDTQQHVFGRQALIDAVYHHRSGSAEEIARALLSEVEAFSSHTTPTDDIAIVVLQRQ